MAGLFAKGTILKVGTVSSPVSMVGIGNVKSITGPGFDVTVIDTTTHSTSGNFREKAAVLIDAGKLTFMVNYDPSDATLAPATGLMLALTNLTRKGFELHFPTSDVLNTVMHFNGYITAHSFTFPVDNVIEASITIEIDGQPTWS